MKLLAGSEVKSGKTTLDAQFIYYFEMRSKQKLELLELSLRKINLESKIQKQWEKGRKHTYCIASKLGNLAFNNINNRNNSNNIIN